MASGETGTIGLSQFLGSDKPTYMGDYNGDMLKIDNEVAALRKADKDETLARKSADEALSIAIADKLKDPKGNDTQILNGKGVPIEPMGFPVDPATDLTNALKPFTAGGAYASLSKFRFVGEFKQENINSVFYYNADKSAATAKDALFISICAYNKGPYHSLSTLVPFTNKDGVATFGNFIHVIESNHYDGAWSKRIWLNRTSTNVSVNTSGTDNIADIAVNIWLIKDWSVL